MGPVMEVTLPPPLHACRSDAPDAAADVCSMRTPTKAHSSTMIIRHPKSIGSFMLEPMSLSIPLSASWVAPTRPDRAHLPPRCDCSLLKRAAASVESIAPYPLSARSLDSRVLSKASSRACR